MGGKSKDKGKSAGKWSWDDQGWNKGGGSNAGTWGSGKGKGHHDQWSSWKGGYQDGADEADYEGEKTNVQEQMTTRIVGRYQFSKSLLRTSADKDGSSFYKDRKKDKRTDAEILSESALQKDLTAGNAHMVRRPGIGISEAMASTRAGVDIMKVMLNNWDTLQPEKIVDIFTDDEVSAALQALDFSADVDRDVDNTAEALQTMMDFIAENADMLLEKLPQLAIIGSRMYLCSVHFLMFMTCVRKPKKWAAKIPDNLSDAKSFKKWLNAKGDKEKMVQALAGLMCVRKFHWNCREGFSKSP